MSAQNRAQASAQEATRQEVAPSFAAGQDPTRNYGREKFAEPRSWALKWCGFSLSCSQNGDTERSEKPATWTR